MTPSDDVVLLPPCHVDRCTARALLLLPDGTPMCIRHYHTATAEVTS